MPLDGPRLSAPQGKAGKLIVLCHGYGSNGHDLIALAQSWSGLLPEAAYFAPHAPLILPEFPSGRAWFPLTTLEPDALREGCATAHRVLDNTLDNERQKLGLSWSDIALVGFSQGAMMALYTGIMRSCPLGGIVSYSGAFVPDTSPAAPTPGLLIHGLKDDVVPAQALFSAAESFSELALPCRWHIQPHLGHAIDEEGLKLGGAWLKSALSGKLKNFIPPETIPS